MPITLEGRAVMDALDRPGVWKRAGMGGDVVGLDIVEAMSSLPRGCDTELARSLFIAAEAPFLMAFADQQRRNKDH